jgi:hypothetical protein
MSVGETARKNYESVRLEFVQRIQLRDNIILAFLGATGTVFGIALATAAKPEILLIIPYLALGTTVLTVHHHSVMMAILDFTCCELEPFLAQIGESAPLWDSSQAVKRNVSRFMLLRTSGHYLIINVPSIAGLLMNWRHKANSSLSLETLWWFGVAATLISIFVATENHIKRIKLQARINHKSAITIE